MDHYKALFLDLDGTLLDIEVSFFLGPMVEAMHGCFADLLDPEPFREGLFGGTESIMTQGRSEGETNLKAFNRAFARITGVEMDEIEDRFGRFYSRIFPTLGRYGRPMEGAAEFVSRAADSGYLLGLATNPIFPRSAVVERLRWSGVDPDFFSFIPGLENMSSCKPDVRFYTDLASRYAIDPAQCLMVGNDVEQDLPASQAGMGTFLVEERLISRGLSDLTPDARGSLRDLARILRLGL